MSATARRCRVTPGSPPSAGIDLSALSGNIIQAKDHLQGEEKGQIVYPSEGRVYIFARPDEETGSD